MQALRRSIARPALAVVLALAAAPVLAHPDHGTASLATGLAHPLGGIDHLLAMIAVGLFAARQPGGARRMLPAGFVLAMLAGAALSAAGIALPAVETGIAASVLVFGVLIASLARLPLMAALPLVAAFALFHGHAHHAEMGAGSALAYTAGFALATAALHLAGLGLGRLLPDSRGGRFALRVGGGAIAGAGVLLLGA
ncbi:HupE/UreJ family protein [Thauera sp.]|jgi:urease accessory protein|uniref:HupE/UreJ family protein n=1 Tax=Thauera sp. TaxID=1905334 RepID=UPI00262D433B|nr:HupE/UreJ family protein [Thauera sp.]